jgi:hypothetical protein
MGIINGIGIAIETTTQDGVPSGGPPFEYTAIDNNYSMTFDGTNRISIPEVVYSGAFSFSFWVKPASLTNAFVFGDIISNSYFVWLFSTTQVWLKTNSGSYTFSESGGNNIVIDSWQHITITRDDSNNINCYRNGLAFGSSSTLAGNFELNSIGEVYSAINSWRLNGALDEFATWNTALSQETIEKIYNTTNDNTGKVADLSETPEGAPTAWYRFE